MQTAVSLSSDDSSRIIPVGKVAYLLGVSRRTIERLVSRREFPPPLKVGARSFFFRADVEAFLARLAEKRENPA